jgi:hypothetical protein
MVTINLAGEVVIPIIPVAVAEYKRDKRTGRARARAAAAAAASAAAAAAAAAEIEAEIGTTEFRCNEP